MSIQIDGIVSGLNTSAMINAMVGVYSLPRDALVTDIANTTKTKEAIAGVMNRLDAIDEAVEDIEDEDDFKVYKADYEETDAFKVTTENGAIPGNYSIQVNTLATSELEVSQGFDDKGSTGVIATGELVVRYGEDSTTLTIDSSTSSLTELASLIDDIDGLSAYVLDTGASEEPYKLVVQGEDTGADNAISFSTVGLTGSGTVPEFTEQRSAGDAEIEINGITVSDSDNDFGDAVPGLDIEVLQTTESAENVTVSLDKDSIESNVQSILDAYNDVINYIDSKQSYNADLGIKGPLVGESTVNRVIRGIQSVVKSDYTSATEDLSSLSLMGITTSSDGTLSLDSSEFGDALDTYLDDVVAMFTDDDGFGAAMRDQVDVYTDSVDGTLKSFKSSLEGRIDDMEDQVADYNYRITRYESRLRQQFSAMESLLGGMQGTSNYMSAYLGGQKS